MAVVALAARHDYGAGSTNHFPRGFSPGGDQVVRTSSSIRLEVRWLSKVHTG